MRKIKVLIVDDSIVFRSLIKAALLEIESVEIVGFASNGRLAIDRLAQSPIDLLILDLEMPDMDGLETLKQLRRIGSTCKSLIFSSGARRSSEAALEALRLGASDIAVKPAPADGLPQQAIRAVLEPKIQGLFVEPASRLEPADEPATTTVTRQPRSYPKPSWESLDPRIVVIGSSTGGPAALEGIFSLLKSPLRCPIVIAQHMPPVFTAALADRLSFVSGIPAREASHGETLQNGRIYLAPGNYHLRLKGTPDRVTFALDQGPLINWVRPAVDPLFESAAEIFGSRCLAIVLTGMGEDGKVGADSIKRNGGIVVIQEKDSCVVFGMPQAVFISGAYDRICSPAQIAELLKEKAAHAAA